MTAATPAGPVLSLEVSVVATAVSRPDLPAFQFFFEFRFFFFQIAFFLFFSLKFAW